MKIFLKGNYESNFIVLDIVKSKIKTDKVFINIHGLYGLSGDKGSKSRLLGKTILNKNIANVVQYSSSRNWNIYDDADREKSMLSFKHKTFNEERQDLIDTIDLLITNSKDLFLSKNIRFFIVANSLGGTIISSLSERFQYIEKIVLCGSGTGASSSTKPILSTYPSKELIKNSASQFKGEVMLLQGSKDETVPLFSQDELISSYTSSTKNIKKVIEGANHNFSSINRKNRKLAVNLYITEIISFLQ